MKRDSPVFAGLRAALLLARGHGDAVQLVGSDHAAAIWSFWAIPLCLPAVVSMKLLEWTATRYPPNPALSLGRYLLLFVVGWLLFVWCSEHMTSVIGDRAKWPRFIALWGYCSVIENMLVALGGLPGAFGAPAVVDQVCQLVTFGWAFWLEWFAIRQSLQVGALTAAIFLVVDLAIGTITLMIGSLLG